MKITLTDGDCMQPKMSRSGLYGIRPSWGTHLSRRLYRRAHVKTSKWRQRL